ncbi:hypothetical protein [Paenibacillus sanguinis]|uniref:hypothetical protein n=1 Tax=Paenibacillus sanguinis TaxID=225906 RepID=UPI00036EAC9D|nr:hypothetical protein [Paenibacillus sanguinis]
MTKEPVDVTSVQTERAMGIVKEILGGVNLQSESNQLTFSQAQKSALESYAAFLEEQERVLKEQLNQVVVELSAKIAAVQNMLHSVGYEIGREEGIQRKLKLRGTFNEQQERA